MKRTRKPDSIGDGTSAEEPAALNEIHRASQPQPARHRLRLPRPPRLAVKSRLVVAGLLGLAIVLMAAAVLVPLSMPRAGEASRTSATAVWPSATPSDQEATPTPEESRELVPTTPPNPKPVAKGWPVEWQPSAQFGFRGGPDGTIFLWDLDQGRWSVTLDRSGHQQSDWLTVPDGHPIAPLAFGPDGTIYGGEMMLAHDLNSARDMFALYAFDADGTLLPGWPVELPVVTEGDGMLLAPGPSGTVYVKQGSQLAVYGHDGRILATAPAPAGCTDNASQYVRPDGTLYYECVPDPATDHMRFTIYDSSLHKLSNDAAPTWQHWSHGADGEVVASTDNLSSDGSTALSTDLAVIGTDGKPAPGWPIRINGAVSDPLVAGDGSVYVVVGATSSHPAQIMGLLPNGQTKPGWPHSLPSGVTPHSTNIKLLPSGSNAGPYYPVEPTFGRQGTLYLPALKNKTEYMYAIDSDGTVVPGWPAALPSPPSLMTYCIGDCAFYAIDYTPPLFVSSPSGGGLLYVHTDKAIVALNEDGTMASGWPKSGDYGAWAAMPDGGLAALVLDCDSDGLNCTATVSRWLPDGSLATGASPGPSPTPQLSPSPS